MPYKFQEEEVTYDLFEEVLPLLEEHREEISIHGARLRPDIILYVKMYLAGRFKFYSARDEETGIVVGYAAYWVNPHIHYMDYLTAQQDILFVSKEKRKGLLGVKLIKFSENQLEELGVNLILQHSKFHYDLSPLLKRLGYSECDKIFSKEI